MKYQYTPAIGAHVKLRTFESYTARGIAVWSWFEVLGTGESDNIELEVLNGSQHTGQTCRVQRHEIEKPIGWSEVYTIACKPEQLEMVQGWLPRGIVVRQSNYIGDASTQFQPMDMDAQSHWKFGTVTDTVTPEQVADRIRLVTREYVYDAFVMRECIYCHDVGNREYPLGQGVKECHVCRGTGKSARHFAEMDKAERKVALEELTADGWSVQYEKPGRHWSMEREIVIKESELEKN